MTTSPLIIWRFTDSKPGHMQQTLGLTQALAQLTPCEVINFDVATHPVGLIDFLLGRFLPDVAHKRPDIIIGAGHATHFALLAARRAVGGRAVVLMKPSLPLFFFDYVIAPEHDGLLAGPRVLNTLGVLNPMKQGEKKQGSLLFLVGGPSKHVQWDDAVILAQIDAVIATLKPDSMWHVTDSRRTPDSLRAELQRRYGARFQLFAQCSVGWLAERMAVTETVWVSEDSVSMVYESLTAGCFVGLLQLPQADRTTRVMKGVEKLLAESKVTGFADWSRTHAMHLPEGFNEASRVAKLLLQRLSLRV